jgi:hypothetical protein
MGLPTDELGDIVCETKGNVQAVVSGLGRRRGTQDALRSALRDRHPCPHPKPAGTLHLSVLESLNWFSWAYVCSRCSMGSMWQASISAQKHAGCAGRC